MWVVVLTNVGWLPTMSTVPKVQYLPRYSTWEVGKMGTARHHGNLNRGIGWLST